jgi:hypothetical protein
MSRVIGERNTLVGGIFVTQLRNKQIPITKCATINDTRTTMFSLLPKQREHLKDFTGGHCGWEVGETSEDSFGVDPMFLKTAPTAESLYNKFVTANGCTFAFRPCPTT